MYVQVQRSLTSAPCCHDNCAQHMSCGVWHTCHCSLYAPLWKLSVCDLYFSRFSCSMMWVRRQGGDHAPQYSTRLASPSARRGHRSCSDPESGTCQERQKSDDG